MDIVLADTSFALAEDIEGRSVSLTSCLNYDYKRVDNVAGLSPDRREDVVSVLDRKNGSVGDFIVAQRIVALDPSMNALKIKFARDYSSDEIKADSVVLIGSRMNFSMENDPVSHKSSIRNRQPTPREAPLYMRSDDKSRNEGLSVIAFMPGLSRAGSALIIKETNSQATRAAGKFVTSDTELFAFLARTGSKHFPYFEILLRE